MNKENKDTLEGIIKDDLNNLKNYGFNDEQKKVATSIVLKELELVNDYEKLNLENEIKLKELEIKKDIEERKIAIEKEKLAIELTKIDIEKDNLAYNKEKDNKEIKNRIIISSIGAAGTVLAAIGTLIGKCMYFKLAKTAQKYDYEEFKIESKSSSENRNKLDR